MVKMRVPVSVKRDTSAKPEIAARRWRGAELMLMRHDTVSQYTVCFHVGNTQISVVLCSRPHFLYLFHSSHEMTGHFAEDMYSGVRSS